MSSQQQNLRKHCQKLQAEIHHAEYEKLPFLLFCCLKLQLLAFAHKFYWFF